MERASKQLHCSCSAGSSYISFHPRHTCAGIWMAKLRRFTKGRASGQLKFVTPRLTGMALLVKRRLQMCATRRQLRHRKEPFYNVV